MKIVIPYKPRFPQGDIHKELESHRFCVLVAHRRMGKTVLAVNHLIKQALLCKLRAGSYAYVAPFRKQAKKIAWGYLKYYTKGIPYCKVHEGDLKITLPNGAEIEIYGADNPDAIRGAYYDGVILDEVAQMRPEIWGEIFRPTLADRKGWCVFLGTPKGINLFSQMYDKALNLQTKEGSEWKAMLYSVLETNAIPPDELASLREEMSENEFKQEFLCDFNAAADDNLIPIDLVREAKARYYPPSQYDFAPIVMGVDVARFGSDASVIQVRQGLKAFEPIVYRGLDNMTLADRVATKIDELRPDAVFIDQGAGTGVIDRLRQLRYSVNEVAFGGQANDPLVYANRRIEMWEGCKKWLQAGGAIPTNTTLEADLCAPCYGYTPKGLKILEAKEKVKERIGRSPDLADALCLTFAAPVGGGRARSSRSVHTERRRTIRDPYA